MRRQLTLPTTIALAFLLFAEATPALAQPAEAEQFSAGVADREENNDITLRLQAGATLNYGNARSLGASVGGLFAIREGEHAFALEASWAYGMAASRVNPAPAAGETPDYSFGDFQENANNFNARARYDFFLSPDDSIWAELRGRNDPFAFLVPQVTGQAGYQRALFREENHRLWFELGVDYSYQNFGQALPGNDDMGVSPANQLADRSILAYKALLGYTNETSTGFTYNTRLEVLGTIAESVPTAAVDGPASTFAGEPGHLRIQWVNQFRSTIEDWLQLSLDITGRLDSLPAGQASPWNEQSNQPTQMFDLLTTLNLVGNFDLDGEPVAEEPPAPEPEPEAESAEAVCPVCPVCPEAAPCAEAGSESGATPAASEGATSSEGDPGAAAEGDAAAESEPTP